VDEFTVNWNVDSDPNMTASYETIKQQFETTKTRTTDSFVHKYGSFEFTNEQVEEFQGSVEESRTEISAKSILEKGITQWDVRLEALYLMLSNEQDITAKAKIQMDIYMEILYRYQTEYLFRKIVSSIVPRGYNNTLEY